MRRVLFPFVALLALASAADAAFINFINQQPGGTHWGQANTGATYFWSDSLAPQAGNDYRMGSPYAGGNLRTPEASSSTFAGDSLLINPTGQLLLKSNADTRVYTVNDLILNGGAIVHGSDGRTITLDGNITLLVASAISSTDPNPRRINLDAQLHGSVQLNISLGADDWIRLRDDNSDFSGTWNLTRVSGSGASTPYLDAQVLGSLGTGNIIVGTGLILDLDYDRTNYLSTLTLNGLLTLDQTLGFRDVIIGGTPLADGIYSFATLNTLYDAYFVDGGTGLLLVNAPEPATLTLLALGGLGLLRRRSRNAKG
jgi:hypothetical protein